MNERMLEEVIGRAAEAIRGAKWLTAFSGAGISVESGIPPFRGPDGVWNKYDPSILDLEVFQRRPEDSWPAIKAMFTSFLGTGERPAVRPNRAHEVLAAWEREGRLKCLITQNIDGLHAAAGSERLVEFHGHCRTMTCLGCGRQVALNRETTAEAIPRCERCRGLLKPDFVFFGEGIPERAMREAEVATGRTDCMVLAGTSGVVYPAAALPVLAKRNGAVLVEVNPVPSDYTDRITDIFIPLKAGEAFERLQAAVAG